MPEKFLSPLKPDRSSSSRLFGKLPNLETGLGAREAAPSSAAASKEISSPGLGPGTVVCCDLGCSGRDYRRLSCPRTQDWERYLWPSGLSSKQTLSERAGCQVPRPRHPHPLDPTALTCPSLGRKGGAWRRRWGPVVSGGRSPLFSSPSSSAVLLGPRMPPTHTHTSLGERPAAAPDLPHFASALGDRPPPLASTSGRWPGRAGQVAASQAGRGQSDG